MPKEKLVYTVDKGLFDENQEFNAPIGSMINVSENVLYDRNKVLSSYALPNFVVAHGGNKVFVLDANFIGMMGKNITTKKAVGNMLQTTGRNLWFVGNSIGDTDTVRVSTSFGATTNIGALSSTPQLAKYNGSGWDSPVQVGLAPQDETPELILTTDLTRGASFSGLLTGSLSARLARKRDGTVSIASGASNVVTGDTDSVYVTIPAYVEDGSPLDDRVWLLYFTPLGFGSQYAHLLFPIEIPERKLDGTDALGWTDTFGNATVKVISQHASTQASRKIEIEFNVNDLLTLEPFDDYFAAGSCKFLATLGNVMCLIGSGTDSTAFDVSFPNNREAFPPEWRDWFPEVPISIATSNEQGVFWVLGTNTVTLARWTGATQQTAPVVLELKNSKYGAIGEQASVVINGILYGLSKGKTLYRINANGDVDDTFGNRIKKALSSFTSDTILSYNEANNALAIIDGQQAYEYQIDNDVFSSKLTYTSSNGTSTAFSMNGKLYVCWFNSGTSLFNISEWNAGADQNWNITTSFQTGTGLKYKDIIELEAVVSSGADTNPSFSVSAYKDWSLDSATSLATLSTPLDATQINKNQWIESLDYRSIGMKISGTLSGMCLHVLLVTIDSHTMEAT